MEDLASHSNLFQDPISAVYKGIRVWELPPNGQGLVALIALNILSCFSDDTKGKCFPVILENTRIGQTLTLFSRPSPLQIICNIS